MINKYKYSVLVLLFCLAYNVHAMGDDFKKEIIRKHVPIVILDSRDVTSNGNPIEPEPLDIMVDNAEYKILLTSFNGRSLESNHGLGGKDILSNLLPVGRMYWTNGSAKNVTNSQSCLVNDDPSCKEPLYKVKSYLPKPGNCSSHPFCSGGQGLYGYPYYQFFDWPGDTPDAWKQAYDQHCNNYKPTVYATVFENTEHYIIQYYYFTPLNDFVNDHEGDWENVNVYVNKNDRSKVEKMDYLFHHKFVSFSSGEGKFDLVDGHPVLYSGGYANHLAMQGTGSHGLFPYPGEYDDIETGCPESIDGKGKVLYDEDFNIKYVLEDTGDDPFYYPVYWGRSADLGWVDNACAMAVWIPDCASAAFQKPPMSRTLSGRWKRTAANTNSAIEEVQQYTKLPSRSNSEGLAKVLKKYSKGIVPIINLLIE